MADWDPLVVKLTMQWHREVAISVRATEFYVLINIQLQIAGFEASISFREERRRARAGSARMFLTVPIDCIAWRIRYVTLMTKRCISSGCTKGDVFDSTCRSCMSLSGISSALPLQTTTELLTKGLISDRGSELSRADAASTPSHQASSVPEEDVGHK
jgi:hypothetical protein